MRVLVDGDATPYKDEIYSLTKTYHIEMHVYVDYAHILKDVPYQVIECDVGHDSVDLLLLSHLQKQDILITQDYGLAALALGKGAYILHISGMEITSQNIDELLLRRYIGAHQRKSGKHIKGPSKQTQEDKQYFLAQLENLLKKLNR